MCSKIKWKEKDICNNIKLYILNKFVTFWYVKISWWCKYFKYFKEKYLILKDKKISWCVDQKKKKL